MPFSLSSCFSTFNVHLTVRACGAPQAYAQVCTQADAQVCAQAYDAQACVVHLPLTLNLSWAFFITTSAIAAA